MLISTIFSLFALTAPVIQSHSLHSKTLTLNKRTIDQQSLTTDFQACETSLENYIPIFTEATRTGDNGKIANGLIDIRHSFALLGSKCGVAASVDDTLASTLSELFFECLTKLQILIKILHGSPQFSNYEAGLLRLQLPLNILVSFLKVGGVDINSMINSYGDSIDPSFLVTAGIKLNLAVLPTLNLKIAHNVVNHVSNKVINGGKTTNEAVGSLLGIF
ncbi:secreted protein [Melampsora americana]|nr:secreted protein [Melampsora americana]KAH9809258.1 secreted protein [Melampsora americana]